MMNDSIKAIVLDVDGVIIGEKVGYNSPEPSHKVIKALSELKQSGIIVSFCTGKPYLAVEKIIKESGLYNLHITDGGAVLMDPVLEKMTKNIGVPSKLASDVINMYIENNEYMEFYTPTEYFIQKSQKSDITDKHTFVLQKAPKIVNDLAKEALKQQVTKVMVIAADETTRFKPNKLFMDAFNEKLNLRWGLHPAINPLQFGVITAKGISKGKMLLNLAKEYSIKPEEVLAIGDSNSDWDFMQEAGFVATVGNGQDELKGLVISKKANGYVGAHVDDDGFLDIVKHFGFIS